MMKEVTHATEEITPEVAEKYLAEHNNLNRPIREWRVRMLVHDMKKDSWMENGEAGVTFDWDGQIAGGQHTLEAVRRSGVTIRCRVTRGVNPQARSTMNDSYKQRFSDDLSVAGIKSSGPAEHLLRKIMAWEDAATEDEKGLGGLAKWRNTKFTRPALAAAWPEYAEGIVEVITFCEKWREMWPGNRGALHFTAWLLTERYDNNRAVVQDFLDRVCFGSQDEEDQILNRIRAKFAKDGWAEVQVYWMSRGWNAWSRREKLGKLQAPNGGISNPYPRLQRAR